MTLEISHLVVDGCSLTYCQGLENPHIDGWPALLAKKIGVPVVNLALGGSSNDGIQRRTYNYFYKSLEFYDSKNIKAKPFYINAMTYAGRREEYFKQYYQNPDIERYYCLDLSPNYDKITAIIDNHKTDINSIAAYVEYGYLLNFDLLASHIKKLHHWASLVNLYKANNISYATADYIPTYNEEVEFIVKSRYKSLINLLYDENYLGDFADLTRHLPKLPCQHDGLEAQQVVCDYIYDKLLKQYGDIVVCPIETVYKLKQFYITEPLSKLARSSQWY